ncbi:hypothetical protein, partial [uncultured Desulfovibrio sp.]|uniref:hypothetical protein n=1 Tax=uncultured Desulfovibrio sp. TaxID=167968 RepID=UPI00263822AA
RRARPGSCVLRPGLSGNPASSGARDFPEAADNVGSPENQEQVAAWPRRERLIFASFRQAAAAAFDGANTALRYLSSV